MPTRGHSNPKFTADLSQTLARAPDTTHARLTECCPPFSAGHQCNKNSVQKGIHNTFPCTPSSTDHTIISNAIYTMKTVMCHCKKGDAFTLPFAPAENWVSGKRVILGASAGICLWVYSTGETKPLFI